MYLEIITTTMLEPFWESRDPVNKFILLFLLSSFLPSFPFSLKAQCHTLQWSNAKTKMKFLKGWSWMGGIFYGIWTSHWKRNCPSVLNIF